MALAFVGCGGSANVEPPQHSLVPIPFPPDPCQRFQIQYAGPSQSANDCPPILCPCTNELPSVYSPAKGCVTSVDCEQFCAESQSGAELACTQGACSADSDCESGDPCIIVPGATSGTCQSWTDGSCIDANDCPTGSRCVAVTDAGSRRCIAPIEGGGPTACNTNADCKSGQCALPDGSFLGSCSTGAVGEVCFRAADCGPGARCDGQHCTDGGIGSPCVETGDCNTGYCASGLCNEGNDGDYCNVADDCKSKICVFGSICSSGATDAACGIDADCASGDCAGNNALSACTTGTPGSKCLDDADCRSGQCRHPSGVNPNAVFGACD